MPEKTGATEPQNHRASEDRRQKIEERRHTRCRRTVGWVERSETHAGEKQNLRATEPQQKQVNSEQNHRDRSLGASEVGGQPSETDKDFNQFSDTPVLQYSRLLKRCGLCVRQLRPPRFLRRTRLSPSNRSQGGKKRGA